MRTCACTAVCARSVVRPAPGTCRSSISSQRSRWTAAAAGMAPNAAPTRRQRNEPTGEEPRGYLFYDSTKALPASKFRDDVNAIGMPLTAICNREYSDARQRQLFKNIIYVGALSTLLEIEPETIAELIGEQYKGKEALLKPNVQAMHMGRAYAENNLDWPLGVRVRRTNAVGDSIFIEGNSAAA